MQTWSLYMFTCTHNQTWLRAYDDIHTHTRDRPLLDNTARVRHAGAVTDVQTVPWCLPWSKSSNNISVWYYVRWHLAPDSCQCASSSGGTIVPQDEVTQTVIKVFYNKTTQAALSKGRCSGCFLWLMRLKLPPWPWNYFFIIIIIPVKASCFPQGQGQMSFMSFETFFISHTRKMWHYSC